MTIEEEREIYKIVKLRLGLFRGRYDDCYNMIPSKERKNEEDSEKGATTREQPARAEGRESGVITLSVKASS